MQQQTISPDMSLQYSNLLLAEDPYEKHQIYLFDVGQERDFEQRWYVNWVKEKLNLIR